VASLLDRSLALTCVHALDLLCVLCGPPSLSPAPASCSSLICNFIFSIHAFALYSFLFISFNFPCFSDPCCGEAHFGLLLVVYSSVVFSLRLVFSIGNSVTSIYPLGYTTCNIIDAEVPIYTHQKIKLFWGCRARYFILFSFMVCVCMCIANKFSSAIIQNSRFVTQKYIHFVEQTLAIANSYSYHHIHQSSHHHFQR
jgi:hypothetical protein